MIKYIRSGVCLIALVYFFVNTCLAEGINEKWQPFCTTVINGQMINFFIDAQSYKTYDEGDKIINCRIKIVSENGSGIQHLSVRAKDLTYIIDEYIVYDKNGNQIQNGDKRSEGWKQASPSPEIESMLMDIVVWVEKQNKEKADKISGAMFAGKERTFSIINTSNVPDLSLAGPVKQVIVTSPSDPEIPSNDSSIFKFSKKGLLTETQEWKNGNLSMQVLYDDHERQIERYSFNNGYKKRMSTFIYDDINRQYTRYSSNDIEKGTLDDYGNIATTQYGEGKVFEFRYIYDAQGRITQITEGSRTTNIEYDPAGRVVRQSAKIGEVTYEYDNKGHLIKYIRKLTTIPNLVSTYTDQEFDNYGNWTRRLVRTELNGTEKSSEIQTRMIDYY